MKSTSTSKGKKVNAKDAWTQAKEVDACFGCKAKFSMSKHKHHCRSCGQVFCDSCTQKRIHYKDDPKSKEKIRRVCNPCYALIDGVRADAAEAKKKAFSARAAANKLQINIAHAAGAEKDAMQKKLAETEAEAKKAESEQAEADEEVKHAYSVIEDEPGDEACEDTVAHGDEEILIPLSARSDREESAEAKAERKSLKERASMAGSNGKPGSQAVELVNVIKEGLTYTKIDGDLYEGEVVFRVDPPVQEITVIAGQTNKHVKFGITPDKDDDWLYSANPAGRYIGLFPGRRLFKPPGADSTYDTSDIIQMKVERGCIVAYKNAVKLETWANCIKIGKPLWIKILFCETGAMLKVLPPKDKHGEMVDHEMEELARSEAKRETKRRVSGAYRRRVQDCIDCVPMNKGLNWAEYSATCYERFGRHKSYGCSCGRNIWGASGLCRICGKAKSKGTNEVKQVVPQLRWSDDLWDLCSPLMDPDVTMNHSEQQYALRAVRQHLKAGLWDWKGPARPLSSAAKAGCADLVFVMLECGMSPDEADVRGSTPLHAATFAGRADICNILLEGKANVNSLERHGQTPLFFAGTLEVCSLLCESQADPTVVNSKSQTALHLAGRAGLRDVVEFLFKRCSKNVQNLKDTFGATAQHYLTISDPQPPEEVKVSTKRLGVAGRAKSERRWRSRVDGCSWDPEASLERKVASLEEAVGKPGKLAKAAPAKENQTDFNADDYDAEGPADFNRPSTEEQGVDFEATPRELEGY